MRRWLARFALVAIALGVGFGLWAIPTGRRGVTHVWPVHSHHFGVLLAVGVAWVVLGAVALLLTFVAIAELWEEAR